MNFLTPCLGSLILISSAVATPGLAELPAAVDVVEEQNADATPQAVEMTELSQERPAFLGVAVVETRAPGRATPSSPPNVAIELTVSAVHPGSPAEIAGLQSGDILLKIDDQQILHPVQLQRLVARLPVDQEVVLAVRRGDETLSLNAALAPRPAELIAARRPIPPDFQLAPQPGWQEGFERRFRIEPLDMGAEPHDLRQMHERMRQHFDQLFEAPGLEMPEGLRVPMVPLPEPGERLRMQSVRVVDDGQHRLTVTADPEGRHLKAVAADGTVLFEGPINTPEELETVPEVIREKIPLEQPNPRPASFPEGRAV